MKFGRQAAHAGEQTVSDRVGRSLVLLLLMGMTILPVGCSKKEAVVVPQSVAQQTAARIQAVNNDPHLSAQQKQQEVQALQAEAKQ